MLLIVQRTQTNMTTRNKYNQEMCRKYNFELHKRECPFCKTSSDWEFLDEKVTTDDVYEFLSDDNESLEMLSDIINGDYSVKALRQDYIEYKTSKTGSEGS